jgi:quinol monooxygenase YgiN
MMIKVKAIELSRALTQRRLLGFSKGGQIMELFIFARFHARPGQETGVETALRKVIAPTRQERGCLSIHAFYSIWDARLFYIHWRWVDEAGFDNHVGQSYTKQFVEEAEPLVDHELDTTRATVIE